MVRGLKNAFVGGEGLFLATLTGPGRVWAQSLPFSRLAGRILSAAPQSGGSQGEGSLLGSLGNMVMETDVLAMRRHKATARIGWMPRHRVQCSVSVECVSACGGSNVLYG